MLEEAVMDTDYVYDMVVLDETKDGLQETTDLLSQYASYTGLKINSEKRHGYFEASVTTSSIPKLSKSVTLLICELSYWHMEPWIKIWTLELARYFNSFSHVRYNHNILILDTYKD